MDEYTSKVYIQIDNENRILRPEGGYTIDNIKNFDDWIFIDEGTGDRYNLCQAHYFDPPLYTEDGICRWKYLDGLCVLRTAEEIEADRVPAPVPEPEPDIVPAPVPEPEPDIWDELDAAYREGVDSI